MSAQSSPHYARSHRITDEAVALRLKESQNKNQISITTIHQTKHLNSINRNISNNSSNITSTVIRITSCSSFHGWSYWTDIWHRCALNEESLYKPSRDTINYQHPTPNLPDLIVVSVVFRNLKTHTHTFISINLFPEECHICWARTKR